MPRRSILSLPMVAAALLGSAWPAHAQTVSDDAPPPASPLMVGDDAAPDSGDAPTGAAPHAAAPRGSGPRVAVTPYIEVGQVVSADLGGDGDVLTYTTVAAGVQGTLATRRVQAAVDLRYERRFSWGDGLYDNDLISGMARARFDVARGFAIEGGALASRASVDGRSGSPDFALGDRDDSADIYAFYVGPTFGRRIGDVDVGAAYRFGYSRAELNTPYVPIGGSAIGRFDTSTNHAAIASIGMRPGMLPVGWRVSGGWNFEDAGQLDQRYNGKHVRLDLTLPVSPTLALVGGVGYEDIAVSYRPPLRDGTGAAVVDGSGRFVADRSQPRQIAFDTSGLIWDAGVLWRPSRRMSLEARVGRRYGDWTYTGAWSLQANANTAYQLSVYDNLTTTGQSLTTGLAALPTDFELIRDPISGSVGSCAFGTGGGTCLTPALASATGFAFRSRGLAFSMSSRMRPWTLGFALGYDRRTYVANGIGALGIVDIDGMSDDSIYAYLSASRPLSDRTSFGSSIYAVWLDSGLPGNGDAFSAGATAELSHRFRPRLSGNAAVSVNVIDGEYDESRGFVSALLGLRYNF